MKCAHCTICMASNKCTRTRHVCNFRHVVEQEAIKDMKPVKWKLGGRT